MNKKQIKLRCAQHAGNEADTFSDTDKGNHDRQTNGKHSDDLIQNPTHHFLGYNFAQYAGSFTGNDKQIRHNKLLSASG